MRKALIASLLLGGCLALRPAVHAAEPLPPLPQWLETPALTTDSIEDFLRQTQLRDGSLEPSIAPLTACANDLARPVAFRAQAWLALSHLHWQLGRVEPAAAAVERGLALAPTPALLLQRARLHDATGDKARAAECYTRALEQLSDGAERELAQLRLILLSTDGDNVTALVEFARSRDRAFRNRAAVALGLLGHPDAALDLFEVYGDEPQQRRFNFRRATWALQAGLAATAQNAVWAALVGQPASSDVRYALALLVEAHALDDSWDRLLAQLDRHPELGADALAVRVEILHRLRRTDDAIELLARTPPEQLTPEVQRTLLHLYDEAGRSTDLVAHLRALIAAQPAALAWPRGLSEHFLEQGQRAEAIAVWQTHLASLHERSDLLAACRAISQQGLDELALSAAERYREIFPESAAAVRNFLLEHHLRRGQTTAALAQLEALDRDLPEFSAERVELAGNYERLHQPAKAAAIWEHLARRPEGLSFDEKMHLAWLYDAIGRREQSFALWKTLWTQGASEAAQRQLESRLLTLSAELGKLGELAVEIERRLAAGQASPRERSLLIQLYTAIDDPASAVEVIQEYFRRDAGGEAAIASLEEQAKVYRTLNRPAAFERVTAELLRLNPAKAVDYTQSLLINQLGPGQKPDLAKVEQHLARLRALDPSADESFGAAVFQMAGRPTEAIESYRRALARHPGRSEYTLLLAELLAKAGRTEEAVGLLQYFAEFLPGDDGFVVAIDGLLNRQLRPDSPVLGWAQRRVLERVALHDDKFYLYDLAAELADEVRNSGAYLTALENSLADAGPRRSSVLRELIAATAKATSAADLARHLRYNRRLIALGEELPPSIYLDLGRNLLRQGNAVEALAVFQTVIDRSDRADLRETAADEFAAAGQDEAAARLYQQALAYDASTPSLAQKLARLRFLGGQPAQATRLYTEAIGLLIAQQLPMTDRRVGTSAGSSGTGANEFARRIEPMRAGLLLSLAPEEVAPTLAHFEARFDAALADARARLASRDPLPLRSFPQLHALGALCRSIALQSSRYDDAERLDRQLLASFAHDEDFVADLIATHAAFGRRGATETLLATAPLPDRTRRQGAAPALALDYPSALRQAIEADRFGVAVRLAVAFDDEKRALEIYRTWLDHALASVDVERGNAQWMLALDDAHTQLSPERFRQLCRAVFAETETAARRRLLGRGRLPALLTAVESALGAPIIATEKLDALVASATPEELDGLDLRYVSDRLPALDWAARWPELALASGAPVAFRAATELALSKPISPATTARMIEALDDRYRRLPQATVPETAGRDRAMLNAAMPRVPAANAALIARLQEVIERWYPLSESPAAAALLAQRAKPAPPPTLERLLGSVPENTSNLTVVAEATRQVLNPTAGGGADPAAISLLKTALERLQQDGPTRKLLGAIVVLRLRAPDIASGELAALLRGGADRIPDDRLALAAAAELCRQLRLSAEERALLSRLIALETGNEAARRRLAALWLERDHPQNALDALGALSPQAPRPNRLGTITTRPPAADDVRWRRLLQTLSDRALPSGSASALNAWISSPLAAALREAGWPLRNATPLAESWSEALAYFSRQPSFVDDLARLDRLLPPATVDQPGFAALSSAWADAVVQRRQLEAELARLDMLATAGTDGTKETLRRLELALRAPEELRRRTRLAILATLPRQSALPAYGRVLLARLAALDGDGASALEVYRLLVTELATAGTSRDPAQLNSELLTLPGLLADAAQHLDRSALGVLVRSASQLAMRTPKQVAFPSGNPDAEPARRLSQQLWFHEFALDHRLPLTGLPPLPATAPADPADAMRVALVKARTGATADALAVFRATLQSANASANAGLSRVRSRPNPAFAALPKPAERWPGAEAWAAACAEAIPTWIEDGSVPRQGGLAALAIVAARQHQYGTDAAARTMNALLRLAAATETFAGETASLIAATVAETGVQLPGELTLRLLQAPGLSPKACAGLVAQLAHDRGAEAALHAGEAQLAFTQDDALLALLERLARENGDTPRAEKFATLRAQASRIRTDLEKR